MPESVVISRNCVRDEARLSPVRINLLTTIPLSCSRATLMNEFGNFLNFRRWTRPGFFRNMLVVMSATAVAQLIGLGFAPILTRLYGPAEFGVLGTYTSVASNCAATL